MLLADSIHHRTWTPYTTQARHWPTLEEARKAAERVGGEPTLLIIMEVTPEGEIRT